MEDFDEKVRDCKAIMINSPSNPTGRIQHIKTLKDIEKLCKTACILRTSSAKSTQYIFTKVVPFRQ